jgi:ribonuclease/clavin/mitogillin
MLHATDYDSVRYFSIGRSWAGRTIMTTGVYFVDGTLIDTGPANAPVEFATILGSVDAEQLVVTHHHEDHIGNAVFAANHLDRTPLMHGMALPLVRNPQPLAAYRKLTWGSPEGFAAEPLGETLHTRNYEFEVIHTPGHAPDHVALHQPEKRWLFAGDLFISERPALMLSSEDVTSLTQSLRRLLELPDCKMFCHHSGAHESHHKALGSKLDFLLGVQRKALTLHDEGRSAADIARHLNLEKPAVKFVSRGEMSARNLVVGLLRDGGVEPIDA